MSDGTLRFHNNFCLKITVQRCDTTADQKTTELVNLYVKLTLKFFLHNNRVKIEYKIDNSVQFISSIKVLYRSDNRIKKSPAFSGGLWVKCQLYYLASTVFLVKNFSAAEIA